MDTAPVCLKPYSVILGCPRAMPTDRWLKSGGHFYHTFKPRACLARRSCATPASCFWSLAGWSGKEAIRLRATKSSVAPNVGLNVNVNVNGDEAGPEHSSGRRSVLVKWLVPGAHFWDGSKTNLHPQIPIRSSAVPGHPSCIPKVSRKAQPKITAGGSTASCNGLCKKRCPCAKSPLPWWMGL